MNNSLLDLLRNGGYILYARHGEATVGEDQPDLSFQYCYTQRNLSEIGKRQAIYYGEVLRRLEIPLGYPILTSPFCRAVITAQLAFGRANVKIDPFGVSIYNLSRNISVTEKEKILDTLRLKLETIPPRGTNQVIIAHSFPMGIGLGQISDMGTVIVKPLGPGNGFEIVGKLSLEDLADLIQ